MKRFQKWLATSLSMSLLALSTGCAPDGSLALPGGLNNLAPSGSPAQSGSSGRTSHTGSSGSQTGSNTSTGGNTSSGSGTSSGGSTPAAGMTPDGSPEDLSKALTVANSSDFHLKEVYHKVIGTPSSDELTATIKAGNDGTIFFAGHHAEVLDKFARDPYIGAMNPDGSLKWMRSFHGPNKEEFPDSGQNAETGGTQHAIAVGPDGALYATFSASAVPQNNIYHAVVLKIDPNTGNTVWAKAWSPADANPLARTNAQAYGLDVDGENVYVTGSTGANKDQSESHIMLLALKTADGSLFYQKAFDPLPRVNDRGYSLRLDGKGNAYIGGNGNGRANLMLVNGINTPNPSLGWIKQPEIGIGGNINAIDVDAAGNAYLSLDRRGAQTFFSAAKINPQGQVQWAKTYSGTSGDRNNTHSIYVNGNDVYVGGRTGQSGFDTFLGDGLMMKLGAADGALQWSTFQFTGTRNDDMAEHRIKGFAVVGNQLYVGGQVYSGNANGSIYAKRWVKGRNNLEDYSLRMSDYDAVPLEDVPTGHLFDGLSLGEWRDTADLIILQNAYDKNNGSPPDGDTFIAKFEL